MAQRFDVEIILGPPGTGKTRQALEHYRACVAECGHDAALLLVPTQRVADIVRGRLLADGSPGLFDFRVMTFTDAADLLLVANHAPVSLISDVQRITVLRSVLAEMDADALGPLHDHLDRPGLVSALLADIDEFKAAGISPDELSEALARAELASAQERAVAEVYRAYQAELQRLRVYDRPGTLWAALELLEEGRARPWDTLRLVVADGFSDFTTVQVRMLAHLARLAGRCIITLTMVPDLDRPELRAIPERTLKALRAAFATRCRPHERVLQYRDEPATDAQYVVRHLFDPTAGPLKRPGGAADGSLQILEAPGLWAEVRMVAREIKQLLARGDGGRRVSPADVAIIARTLDPYESALREVFAEYGLPLFVARGRRLADSPVARPVLTLLDILVADFPRTAVLELWRNPYIDLQRVVGDEYATADEAAEITRRAGIVGGLDQWFTRLNRLENRTRREHERFLAGQALDEERDWQDLDAMAWVLNTLPRVRKTFEALASVLSPLRQPAPRAEMVVRFLDILAALGMADNIIRPDAEYAAADLRTWNAIVAALRGMLDADAYVSGGRTVTPVSLEQFAAEVAQVLGASRIHPEGRGEGRVIAMTVGDALQTSFDYVFVIGLTEGVFPLVHPPDPLLPDECRQELEQRGLPVRLRLAAQDEEAYLFHLALGLARRRVYLCYPTVDAQGDPLLRSLYVDEVLRLVPDVPVRRLELHDVIPPLQHAGSGRELIERALWLQYDGRSEADAAFVHDALQALSRHERWLPALQQAEIGARIERLRDGRLADLERDIDGPAPFGPFDAVLTDPAAIAIVAKRFDEFHDFSPSQLNAYASCPMAFFFQRLLGLREQDEPTLDITAREVGSLLHRVLRRFYERRVQAGLGHVAEDADDSNRQDASRQLLMTAADEVFADFERRELTAHEKLWEVVKRVVRARLRTWLEFEARMPKKLHLAAPPQPAHFEWSFAPEDKNELVLSLPSAGQVIFRGRVDRIDEVGTDGLVVYDYKRSGGSSISDMQQGRDFELVLYALAAENVLYQGQRRCIAWAYVPVGRPPDEPADGVPPNPDHLRATIEAALKSADVHISSMRAAKFPWPEDCTASHYCPFAAICRYGSQRMRRRMRAAGGGTA